MCIYIYTHMYTFRVPYLRSLVPTATRLLCSAVFLEPEAQNLECIYIYRFTVVEIVIVFFNDGNSIYIHIYI